MRGQAPEHRLVVTEHQQVIIRAVAKVKMNALFFAQPLDEVQVGLGILHTERARRVNHRAEFKGIGVGQNAVVFKHLGNNLRHGGLLENPLVTPMSQTRQPWCQCQVISREPGVGLIPANGIHLPMQPGIRFTEVEIDGLMKQRLQIQRRVFADDLQLNEIRLIKYFAAIKVEHLKVVVYFRKY